MRSHTGDTGYRSRGNERADALANDAREHSADVPLPDMLEGEEKVVFWNQQWHVMGDLRADIRCIIEKSNFINWQ